MSVERIGQANKALVVSLRKMDSERTLFSVQPWRGCKARTPNLMSHDVGSRRQHCSADSRKRLGKSNDKYSTAGEFEDYASF